MLSIYATSTPYIQVPITNEEGINPTGDEVQFAFLGPYTSDTAAKDAVPTASTTYYTGAWQSTSPSGGVYGANTYTAIILVGPDGGVVTLTTGNYLVIVRVVGNPEIPIMQSGLLVVS